MKKKQTNAFEFETIKAGNYAVIGTSTADIPKHPVSISYLVDRIQKTWSDLRRHVACPGNAVVIIENFPGIILKLVVPTKTQGALMTVATHQFSFVSDNVPISSNDAPIIKTTRQEAITLEETAMAEAEGIARASAFRSKEAIDVANAIVEKAERESLHIEQASPAFAASPVERISRQAYCRSRGSKQIISFLGDERVLGGGHGVSNHLNSQATFSLTQCRVRSTGKDKNYYLQAAIDDPGWRQLVDWAGYAVNEIEYDRTSAEIFLMRLAEASDQSIDIDVCVTEKISTKGRKLVPLNIRNRLSILATLEERIELIKN